MAYELNDLTGNLFRNKPDSKYPDQYSGSIKINGEEFWLNAKTKDGKQIDPRTGKPIKYFELWLRPKQEKVEPRQQAWEDELSDEIPF